MFGQASREVAHRRSDGGLRVADLLHRPVVADDDLVRVLPGGGLGEQTCVGFDAETQAVLGDEPPA
ncbi:hypothetical protein GCM10025883_09350 [Mobilicoccus caccae]|uniref:Uncharacterized protein n=1 Tax=Mobilicoccus caccae TaxID=1859295 RepID=A0ABQ6ILT2_9MICO|nr:hypothetical protein GCM10025883_09350 [Mobilicoccus caccae]